MGLKLLRQAVRLGGVAPGFAPLIALPAAAKQKKRVCEVALAGHVSWLYCRLGRAGQAAKVAHNRLVFNP